MGDLLGVDVFDMKPLEMTRMGTLEEPIPIFSLVSATAANPPANPPATLQ